jgi:hypothetical protein
MGGMIATGTTGQHRRTNFGEALGELLGKALLAHASATICPAQSGIFGRNTSTSGSFG